jgi:hypothetical protein
MHLKRKKDLVLFYCIVALLCAKEPHMPFGVFAHLCSVKESNHFMI